MGNYASFCDTLLNANPRKHFKHVDTANGVSPQLASVAFDSLISVVKSGKVFDVGDEDTIPTDYRDEAFELLLSGNFSHPYDVYAVTYHIREMNTQYVMLVHTENKGSSCISVFDTTGKRVILFGGFKFDERLQIDAEGRRGVAFVLTFQHFTPRNASYAARVVAFVLRALSDARILREPTRSPTKLRANRNTSLACRSTKLRYETLITEAAARSEPQGGTHASPIAHSRRGHYVTRGTTTYWRRASMVNAGNGASARKQYTL